MKDMMSGTVSPFRAEQGTFLEQETSPQDPALSPDPLLPLGEVAGVEGIDRVHVPFSLTICLRLKSILAPSPHTWIIILKNLGVLPSLMT